ncbi:hypothetical protein HX052_17585 [Myroides marinus]|uniref:hypothetical protein n=1 Tax=Myroides marinus TaxID=703342 RepID=UPI002574CE28|nr:hypothetical protein [Myroides marinus]MDM1370076.1 hypothetical protein [Myroides marinus]MDM1372446.1 hypothetical protein [Myroides marinus]MDM1377062.1 hypothetical protein [Myroides marinus]MDM1384557.1 hypothetical protein [Myroides marinus]MDM1391747.1 hypothetical protein [Myroides marinus]
MDKETKLIKSVHFEVLFKLSEDAEEWYARIPNWGNQGMVELYLDIDTPFMEKNWGKLPDFIEYLHIHLSKHIQKAIEVLPTFAKLTGIFNDTKQNHLDFGFGYCVLFKDNTFFYPTLNNWEFELDFSTNNIREILENIDGYGKWTVTFNGSSITGIRREIW